MKKIYCQPTIKVCKLMSDYIMRTDSNGTRFGTTGDSRRSASFEDDDEEEITKSVWFDD